jgi:hypothetical protein
MTAMGITSLLTTTFLILKGFTLKMMGQTRLLNKKSPRFYHNLIHLHLLINLIDRINLINPQKIKFKITISKVKINTKMRGEMPLQKVKKTLLSLIAS